VITSIEVLASSPNGPDDDPTIELDDEVQYHGFHILGRIVGVKEDL
jgi:hypothetical protein